MAVSTEAIEELVFGSIWASPGEDFEIDPPTEDWLRTMAGEGYFDEIRCAAGSLGPAHFFVPVWGRGQQYRMHLDGRVEAWRLP